MPKTSKTTTATAANNKAARSKANAKRTAQPGIISHIMHVLCVARDKNTMYTFEQVHAAVCKKFADREPSGVAITVRAQLSRLPRQRQFGIDKQRDGVTVYYAAASDAERNAPLLKSA